MKPNTKHNTIVSIANHTGFSVSTVSRVLSGKAKTSRISENTVRLITEEAHRLNFKPSLLAKGLRTKKTNIIGLVISSFDNAFFANLASAIILEARALGYSVITVDTSENEQNEKEGIESLLRLNIDGIIVTPCGYDPKWLEEINRNFTPIILLDRYFSSTELSYISTDNYRGAYEATAYLTQNGHKDILCIQGTAHSMPVKERVRGYLDALKDQGISRRAQVAGDNFSVQCGYEKALEALQSKKRPSAIFALSNTLLLGTMRAVKELGLKVPGEDRKSVV